ncbi:hypothetical protein [Cognaticolwellia mytili]|uniref:hypothetical protein n=1 Tax=Cognaticolwellia mytili TaxID=1888913 RepID=UPI000A16CC34|nr:hypothetical protein [Cognaticolwellia mytili]
MNFKFYKTSNKAFLDKLREIRDLKIKFDDNINLIMESVGAKSWQQYTSGSVACFNFDKQPCKTIWKKSCDGYLPKLSNKEGKKIIVKMKAVDIPSSYNNALDLYSFPKMVMGEPTSRGIPMHDSRLCGKFEKNTFFVKVPQENGNDFQPPLEIFTEVKEWEMLKFMEKE